MKTTSFNMRIRPAIKDALKKAADDDIRSKSSMVEKIITDWLRENGYLK